MEERMNKVKQLAGKYRYVLLVFALGLLLMSLPEGGTKTEALPEVTEPVTLDAQLESILSKIQGVGKVAVLLTESAGAETVYRIDREENQSDSGGSVKEETVLVTGADRGETGLVMQTLPPTYLGAVIVCQGADQPSVALSVVEAVANATGIPTNRITVLKMK